MSNGQGNKKKKLTIRERLDKIDGRLDCLDGKVIKLLDNHLPGVKRKFAELIGVVDILGKESLRHGKKIDGIGEDMVEVRGSISRIDGYVIGRKEGIQTAQKSTELSKLEIGLMIGFLTVVVSLVAVIFS